MITPAYRITDVQKVLWNGRQMLAFTAFELKDGSFVCVGRFTAPRKAAKRDLWKIAAQATADVIERGGEF
jgi:hypothetical protein